MKKLWKAFLSGLFVLGFIVLIGTYSIKAEDNTLIADLNGDGKEEIIYYEPNVKYLDDDKTDYTFKITVDGKEVWSEGYLVDTYLNGSKEDGGYDPLYTLAYIYVEIADINPSDKYQELVASYYSAYNESLLGMKIFRFKKGKLVLVGEDYHISSYSYLVTPQKNNKYLTLGEDYWAVPFGCLWLKRDYKISSEGFTEKAPKKGIYEVGPEFSNEGKGRKFKAARNIKVFSDSGLTNFKGEITKGQKFYVKKVKFLDEQGLGDFVAYVKTTSGLKGWIYVENDYDDNGEIADKLVTNPRWFA